MDELMRGKVVVVTGAGAGAGIGREVALEFGRHGAKVVVNDVSDSASTVAEEVRAGGAEAIASCDSVADCASAV